MGFSVDGLKQENASFSASVSTAQTVLIVAVPENITSVTISNYLTQFYDRQLQDSNNNTVFLTVPLSTRMRLIKIVFQGNLTLDSIISNQPEAFSRGISAVFSIAAGDKSKTLAITMVPYVSYGFVISSISGDTTELGETATFSVQLKEQPASDVSIGISSSDTTEGTVSPSSLTFTASNWDTAQTVTVTGVNDQAADGDQDFTIELAAASSSDPNYDGLDPADVTVTNAAVSSAAGNLDTTFNPPDGITFHHDAAGGNNSDFGYAVAIDADGKILVSGYSLGSTNEMALWRYNADGSLDTTFNSVGYVVHVDAAGGSDYDVGWAVTTDADGKIVVAGHSSNGPNNDMVIWRYNSDGSLDTTFNSPDGFTVHDDAAGGGSGADSGQAVAIDSDGKILVAGNSNNGSNLDMAIWRYNPDGSLDTTFNSTGFTVHDNAAGGGDADYGQAIAIDSDGKILVAGYSWGSNNDMVIWRFNPDGSLDTTFNSPDGFTVHDDAAGGGSGNDYGDAIIIDADGKILVAGYSNNGTNEDMAIWRYNPDGSLDTTFNSVGYAAHDSAAGGSDYDMGRAVAIDSNGKILVAGYSHNGSEEDMAIWRYNPDGSLDTTFNSPDGYVVDHSAAGGGNNDTGRGMAIDSTGKIVVTGYSRNITPNYDMVLWRYQ